MFETVNPTSCILFSFTSVVTQDKAAHCGKVLVYLLLKS